jgi:molybdate transport repressor ModE-like protein/molybdopterin-binding protein
MNVFDAKVVSPGGDGSHAWLAIGRARVAARRWAGAAAGGRVRIAIRPEDVVLCADHPGRVSARNVMPGRVTRLKATPDGVSVDADVGFALTALVTRAAVDELRLKAGAPVYAIVKATAVTPHVEVRPRLRVCVLGPAGAMDPRHLELLRTLMGTPSLVRAARACSISYRTAWLWMKALHRSWGRPLVERLHGGRGGGGSVPTAEARALLREIDAAERRLIG